VDFINSGTSRLRLVAAMIALAAIAPRPLPAAEPLITLYPTAYLYRDIDGHPLPFQDHPTIVEVLRSAPIVDQELMNRGVAGNIKLILEHRDIRIRAVLRVIDTEVREKTGSKSIILKFRDSYIYEAAAYELDMMLGIGRIPPTTLRKVGEHEGTVQIWMERVTPEDILLDEDRLHPPNVDRYRQQKAIMRVFDALIANTDRNQGNLLIDDHWNIWFIDHTRAFRETSTLVGRDQLDTCERRLWTVVSSTDRRAIRELMEPYLTNREIKKLLARRDKLIKHFQKRIDKLGEDAVLFDLLPPEDASSED
jgi:hypothetical protein